ncbi:MAG: septal ring lytic transglycosylase RlpA family protein [Actinomycetota bacterium]|nr:septal ring lytic transglycosylase RlpA family protein [Actinomycetota bacterium]
MLLASPLVAAPPVWASSLPSSGAAPTVPGGPPPAPTSAVPAAPSSSGGASPGSATPAPTASPVATATGDGITVTANVSALLGRSLTFTGVTTPTSAGNTIVVQRLDSQAGWVSVATGTVTTGGAFSVLWRTNYAGHVTIRTVLEQTASASQAGQASPTLQITVFRPAIATFYGKGFFGQRTACGTILRRSTPGVASRTLKCGTLVQIYYGGRSIVVPVIDRGPYANNASWDLTQATAQALGMLGTETVGAMPV